MAELLAAPDSVTDATLAAWRRHLGEDDVEPQRLRADLADGTLPEAFHRAALSAPAAASLEIEGDALGLRELDARAARVGGWLREQGIEKGDRVLLSGASSLELVIAYLGILRAGAAMVPVDPASTEPELRHLVEDSGATAAWAAGESLEHLAAIAGRGGALRLLGALDAGSADAIPALSTAAEQGRPLDPQAAAGDDLAMLAYTSGTTGRPKGVPLTHVNLLSSIRGVMRAWRWRPQDVLVHALPLSHQHGLGGVHATLLAGSRAVLFARFDPERVCAAITERQATVLFAVPAMYQRLVDRDTAERPALGSLRLAVSGSAPLSPGLAERAAALLGGEPPLERYGSTESGLNVSNPYDGPRKIGSVGLPLPGTEMAIGDPDGRPVEAGGEGEILLRGPQVFSSYWGRPEATGESFREGGWFRTGDMGRIDPDDGYLQITGRLKEMILSGGLNVSPREVELVLEEHPSVERAAVVGVPSERWGEEVVGFVVAAGGVDTGAVLDHARAQLSSYKRPKRLLVVDELPLNRMGKVQRRRLVEMARDEREPTEGAA